MDGLPLFLLLFATALGCFVLGHAIGVLRGYGRGYADRAVGLAPPPEARAWIRFTHNHRREPWQQP